MVRKILLISSMLFAYAHIANAQVGIGTLLPDNSAQLDVVAEDRGILIPRIALTSFDDAQTIIGGNTNGLLVYNISENMDLSPGFYYWDASSWKRIISSTDIDDFGGGNVVYNPTEDSFNYIDDLGNLQSINFEEIIKVNETETLLVNNGNGSYTYINEKNVEVSFSVTQSNVGNPNNNETKGVPGDIYVDSSTGEIYTYNSSNNSWELLNVTETLTSLSTGSGATLNYTDEAGTVNNVDLSSVIESGETLT
ncbi:hypothetical protein JM658_16570, partial [Joostella atrarenae]|nr:hypothetical protein [Joostella atrarenae]